jgi:hypothetical protein
MNWFRRKSKDGTLVQGRRVSSELQGWRYFLVLIVAVVAAVLFYAEEDWRGKWAWERHRRQLEAAGISLTPSTYVPPMVPDDENFAMTPLLAPLFAFVPGTQQWRDTNALGQVNGFAPRFNAASSIVGSTKGPHSNSWIRARTDLVRWYTAFLQGTNRVNKWKELVLPNASVAEAAGGLLAGLAEADTVLEELQEAAHRPHARFNLRYEEENPAAILLPHLAALKHVCQILQLRASAALALGQTEQASNDVNLILYIANATCNEPILITHLVRRAELQMAIQPLAEGLAEKRWSERQLGQVQERLEQFNLCAEMKRALEGERALLGCPIIESMRRSPDKYRLFSELGESSGSPTTGLDLRGLLWVAVPSGWFYLEELNYSRTFQDHLLPVIDVSNRVIKPAETDKAAAQVSALTSNTPVSLLLHHRVFSGLLLPGLNGVFQKTAFAQCGLDMAIMACALERYRLAHGELPQNLELLVPQFVAHPKHDVINGQPLRYRRLESGGYLLYSVGWNGTDDGGKIGLAKNGEGLDLNQGDWVWRPEL